MQSNLPDNLGNAQMPEKEFEFEANIAGRKRQGSIWLAIFLLSTVIGIIALTVLLFTIVNQSFGYAAIEYKVDPATILPAGSVIDELSCGEIAPILQDNVTPNRYKTIESEQPIGDRSDADCQKLLVYEVFEPVAKETWYLVESLTNPDGIKASIAENFPDADLVFKSWINRDFITSPQSSDPLQAGIRTAILGSLYVIAVTIIFALPTGIMAAIYLEEYATDSAINRLIKTNINNLAGVPSIIYGMLGLIFFVRVLEPVTSGTIFGISDPTTANGRTILSAGLTLGLLILPVVIINAQEAIKAVPSSLREASYGMGATKWQTIWYHVLPNAISGILTGTILSISRAFGETAPLVVIGAATYITFNPENIFSKFTTVPIQIYQWTSRPQDVFRNIAAASILVLLVLLLSLNAAAIFLRNRYSRRIS